MASKKRSSRSKKTSKRGSKKKTQIPLSVLKKRHAELGRIIARREK